MILQDFRQPRRLLEHFLSQSPMVTPGLIITPPPIQTWFPMVTGLPNSMPFARSIGSKRHHFRKRLIIPLIKWLFFFWLIGLLVCKGQLSRSFTICDQGLITRYIMFSLDHFFLLTFRIDPLLPFFFILPSLQKNL